jgi:hypothetical protein
MATSELFFLHNMATWVSFLFKNKVLCIISTSTFHPLLFAFLFFFILGCCQDVKILTPKKEAKLKLNCNNVFPERVHYYYYYYMVEYIIQQFYA